MSAPTQTELARLLGLSRSTVAAALNPNSPIKLRKETKTRILRAAEKLNYRPHRYAQIMRKGRSGLIGIFHFGGLYQVAAERAWHASQAIQKMGYHVLSSDASWSRSEVRASCETMLDAQVEGIIVAGLHDPASTGSLDVFHRAGIPMVSLSGNLIPGTPQVRADTEDAFYRITKHILRQGRRRLLLLYSHMKGTTPDTLSWTGRERLMGFRRAIKEAGLPIVERLSKGRKPGACVVQADSLPEQFDQFAPARDTLTEILASSPAPDSVICGNDHWAIGAMAALRQAGLTVPGDAAVTGFDNVAVGSYLDVPLTTIEQPTQAMAQKSVELLFRKIQGKRVSGDPVKFPCKLIIRSSCGATSQRA